MINMEIWIRSQDKKRLIKTHRVEIDVKIIRCCDGNYSLYMGEYSTEEKALKVLDMIKEIICEPARIRKVEYALRPSEDYDIYNSKCFQMPQDDEV